MTRQHHPPTYRTVTTVATVILTALGLCAAACRPRAGSWLEKPVERRVTVADVLESLRPGPEAVEPHGRLRDSAHLVARLDVPEDAVLFIDGRIARKERGDRRPIGPSRFSVEIDGREVFAESLEAKGRFATLREELSLSAFAGRTVDLSLRIRARAPEVTQTYWRRLLLQQVHTTPRRPASRGPNLLVVMADTLRADHCSVYGYERRTTPFLEELAGEALVFDRAVSAASWTLPAVSSLFTGLYPPRHGADGKGGIREELETLAESLQREGLTTFAVSANPVIAPAHGFAQGFEEFRHVPWKRAEKVNREFRDWLPERQDLQWFAYLHYIDPHGPYAAPEPEGSAFADASYDGVFLDEKALHSFYLTKNFGLETPAPYDDDDIRYLRDAYDEEVLYWDRKVRELVAFLRDRGLLDDTVLIVLSDHGEEFVDHGMFTHGHQLYQETVRVPLLIRAPGLDGGRRTEPVETRKAFATAFKLLGLDPPAGHEDLLSAARGQRPTVFVHSRYPVAPDKPYDRRDIAAVEVFPWKFIYRLEDRRAELYELEQDPRESSNLAGEYPVITEQFRELLERWLESERSQARAPEAAEIDPELVESLRALGYIQ